MKIHKWINLFIQTCIITTLLSFNNGFAQSSEKNDIELIKNTRIEFNKAIKDYDLNAIAKFLDKDYIITYGIGRKVLNVEDEIKSWEELFTSTKGAFYVRTPTEVIISDNLPLAYEHGKWFGKEGGEETFSGRYTAAWRKGENGWKIHSELFVRLSCEGPQC